MTRILSHFEAGKLGDWLAAQMKRFVHWLWGSPPKPKSYTSLVEKIETGGKETA